MRGDIIFALITGAGIALALWTHAVFALVHRESQQRREPWINPHGFREEWE